jgi:hypothetical protein
MSRIPDLWGPKISVDSLTPASILRAQASILTKRTQGIVRGDVDVSISGNDIVRARLSLLSDTLGGEYTEAVLDIVYGKRILYPCLLNSMAFEYDDTGEHSMAIHQLSDDIRAHIPDGNYNLSRIAHNESAFIKLLGIVFASDTVQNTITSLIANANESFIKEDEEGKPESDETF